MAILSPYRGTLVCVVDCSVVDHQGITFHFGSGNTYHFEYYLEQPHKLRLESTEVCSYFCEIGDSFLKDNFSGLTLYQKENWER